jgi:hypothetical protein
MSSGRENRRNLRLKIDQPLKVLMGSIGGDVRYDLMTRDVSNKGFFLDFEKPGRFPFTPASIMEIWLELEPGNTIFFNGKMARVVYPTDSAAQESGPGIAVRIVQIEKEQEAALVEFINRKVTEGQHKKNSVA